MNFAKVGGPLFCDSEPSQYDEAAGEVTVPCTDGLTEALAAVELRGGTPITGAYLTRPACVMAPCSADELNRATVVVWLGDYADQVSLDGRLDSVSEPVMADGTILPPAAWTDPNPAVRKVVPAGAPAAVANRKPLPYCGAMLLSVPAAYARCFLDSVIRHRPAEVIERGYTTEGGLVLLLDRFDGQGPVVQYTRDGTTWGGYLGALQLNPGSAGMPFSFVPLDPIPGI